MTRKSKLALGAVLLVLPFIGMTSYADEVPVSMRWAGTVADSGVDTNGDGLSNGVIDAQAKGSFGPSVLAVTNEFEVTGSCDSQGKIWYLNFLYSKPVMTFANGDQLWGNITGGWMCLNTETGEFSGEADGDFAGGTGRFADATGWFFVEFDGTELALLEGRPGFGPIRGTIEGAIERD